MLRERLPLWCLAEVSTHDRKVRLVVIECIGLLTSIAWNHLTASGGQSWGYRFKLSRCLRSMTWSPPCWGASPVATRLPFSSSLSIFGVSGGFGVVAREPHGERFERKPCLLSGAAILSTRGVSPRRSLLSQDFARCRGAWVGFRRGGGQASTPRGTRRWAVLAIPEGG
jgi:hypothetical protein